MRWTKRRFFHSRKFISKPGPRSCWPLLLWWCGNKTPSGFHLLSLTRTWPQGQACFEGSRGTPRALWAWEYGQHCFSINTTREREIYIYMYIYIRVYTVYTYIHTFIHTYIHIYFFFFSNPHICVHQPGTFSPCVHACFSAEKEPCAMTLSV